MNASKYGMIRHHNNKLLVLSRLLDCLIMGLTLWSVIMINGLDWNKKFTWWLLVSIIAFQTFAEFNELYQLGRGTRIIDEVKRISLTWLYVIIVFLIIQLFYPLIDPVFKQSFWLWILLVPIEMFSWHVFVSSCVAYIRSKGHNTRRVAIVGATQLGFELEQVFNEEEWMGLNFVGYYDDRQQHNADRVAFTEVPLNGNISDLIQEAKKGNVDSIYIALALRAENRITKIINELADTTVTVYFVPDLFVFDLLSSSWNQIRGIPVFSIYDTPFYGVGGILKRIFDIVFGVIILAIIAIPMLIIALCIKVTMGSPILFKQRRYGYNGKQIVVWKFRTMAVCQDREDVPQAKRGDPRITPLGAVLRKTSLDELPQFLNVLSGDMSIVGPRPHAVAHNEDFRRRIKGYMLRHKVKPGITGLAQVKGFRGETDTLDKMEGRIRYDLQYIRNWSLWLDIKIMFMTMIKAFFDDNAY